MDLVESSGDEHAGGPELGAENSAGSADCPSGLRSRIDALWSLVGATPTVPIGVRLRDGFELTLLLKLEHHNPTGSVKDRTAVGLLADLAERGKLAPGSTVVESTSGNAGVALASCCRELGLGFTAVVDPKAQTRNIERMRSLGAEIVMVETLDEYGGYLQSRLHAVERIVADTGAVWADQYRNPANPASHYRSTGPEVAAELPVGEVAVDHGQAVFVPVSTGGTYTGIRRYMSEHRPWVDVIPVDAVGSVAIGGRPGRRNLTGIGASRASDHIPRRWWSPQQLVSDQEAFAVCRALSEELGLSLGGSSGAVVAAAVKYCAYRRRYSTIVCLCPDSGDSYRTTIYDDGWLTRTYGTAALSMPAPLVGFEILISDSPTPTTDTGSPVVAEGRLPKSRTSTRPL
jgi:cysteine synthase A